jgi:hypothetical protein
MDSISNGFRIAAEASENYLEEIIPKISSQPSYKILVDEHLAIFHVYNYLHGKTFLESRDKLIIELLRMKENPTISDEAINKQDYINFYKRTIDLIIEGIS